MKFEIEWKDILLMAEGHAHTFYTEDGVVELNIRRELK